MRNSTLCDSDFHGWATQQADLLRSGAFAQADIVETLESVGRGERRDLINRLAVLLAHLLTWQAQPGLRGNSWRLTIAEQRRQPARVLAENPRLRAQLAAIVAEACGDARLIAQRETGLADTSFPETSPWTCGQALQQQNAL